ncbi:MAG: exodeoxyribonuclease VII large subunit [Verrucomicrobia bacterium]|nr:exodeoxyribonuclease VII large subunit [Verrucomicrobiota bacterium]
MRAESVSEFTRRVKTLLEGGIRPGWVRGEVSNLRAQASGHIYFSLKDAGAQVSAVLFRGNALQQTVKLRDGLQVIVYGEVSVYELRGQYQLIVRMVVDDGVGRLRREFEALKARLAAEGLFAAEKKRPVPAMPACVGFITSPTGAAVQDFIRIITRRGWRGRMVVLPAKVQGEGAAVEMAAMLALAKELGIFDLLVIGRGGGSLEDLWAFNEEPLVRAVAACAIPILSAVGHEIDFTLCDFAADARAETPSAAAELISSHFVACAERAVQAEAALAASVEGAVARAVERLDHARSRLRLLTPAAQIEQGHLRLDDLANRLGAALRAIVQARGQRLTEARARLERASPEGRVQLASHALLSLWKRLQAASPASVLHRGFVIMRDEAGHPVMRRAAVRPGQPLSAEFADGTLPVRPE